MKRHPFVAGLLSCLVPGLGHIYCGKGNKGAAVMAAAIIIGGLNVIFVPVFVAANPDQEIIWAYWLPRIGHDVISLWSLVFWIWVVIDAYLVAKRGSATPGQARKAGGGLGQNFPT